MIIPEADPSALLLASMEMRKSIREYDDDNGRREWRRREFFFRFVVSGVGVCWALGLDLERRTLFVAINSYYDDDLDCRLI